MEQNKKTCDSNCAGCPHPCGMQRLCTGSCSSCMNPCYSPKKKIITE